VSSAAGNRPIFKPLARLAVFGHILRGKKPPSLPAIGKRYRSWRRSLSVSADYPLTSGLPPIVGSDLDCRACWFFFKSVFAVVWSQVTLSPFAPNSTCCDRPSASLYITCHISLSSICSIIKKNLPTFTWNCAGFVSIVVRPHVGNPMLSSQPQMPCVV